MKTFVSTLLIAGLVPFGATVAVAQSGPVDSKGQAGSVQQSGSGVTQGTNAADDAKSRATMESMSSGGAAGASKMKGEKPTSAGTSTDQAKGLRGHSETPTTGK